jgi:hypothetical protein
LSAYRSEIFERYNKPILWVGRIEPSEPKGSIANGEEFERKFDADRWGWQWGDNVERDSQFSGPKADLGLARACKVVKLESW